ncbi:MAG: thioredoxin family protein, partial [Muribaculaceae bacterium]|nr:thioredoxin family protein [Muribaculaceae bacterium]
DQAIQESIPTRAGSMHHGMQDAVAVTSLLDSIKSKYEGKANVVKADDPYGKLKVSYRLEEYPTYILFKEGQELMRESGRKSEAELDEMIERAL